MKESLRNELQRLGREVTLYAVQANDNAGSKIYVANQKKACEEIGIKYVLDEMSPTASEGEICARLEKLNADPKVSAIILQMPVPPGVDARKIQGKIAPEKDAEGITAANMGRLVSGTARVAPCTPLAVMELLKSLPLEPKKPLREPEKLLAKEGKFDERLHGWNACVVGHSEIVGKPLALMLLQNFCTVTVCHVGTRELAEQTRRAEILISAAGVPNLIKADMVAPGAIVLDVAINRIPELDAGGKPVLNEKTGKPRTKIVGDCDFASVSEKASYITPVPGGVGPVTTAFLLKNVLECAKY
jgi:methylenetetrahydrofolate dehydrogenase (NADP+)/methenyltetrahydrofolate cyclohydrolase